MPSEACPLRAVDGADDFLEVSIRLPRSVVEQAVIAAGRGNVDVQDARIALAIEILRSRRRRRDVFPGVRFGEPSWEMILDLYVSSHRGERVDVSNLCLASGVAMTTAIRHVGNLERRNYVTRQGDLNDRRRTFVIMGARLAEAVDRWLDQHAAALRLLS